MGAAQGSMNMKSKKPPSHIVFDTINTLVLIVIGIACLYPFYYIFIYSISDPVEASKGITFYPVSTTMANFTAILQNKNIPNAFLVSVARTVIGTLVTVIFTSFLAYLFIQKDLPLRRTMYRMVIFTMYLNSGLIPWYVTMSAYGLKNSFMLYILPSAIIAFYLILVKTYLESLPAALNESAEIDGAGLFVIFFRIVLPLSLPIVATIAIFSAVTQWNSWFDNFFLVKDPQLKTLQLTMYEYFQSTAPSISNMRDAASEISKRSVTLTSIRMSIAVITIIPIFLIYPFLQRFFVKGIMLGAVKG